MLAPGTNITSPTWQASNPTSAYASGVNGTSFATPMVSGLITRALSQRPSVLPLPLIAALTENTNRLTLAATVPHDPAIGYGTLDAAKVTSRMQTAQDLLLSYSYTPVSKGGYLDPSEPAGAYAVHGCQTGLGTTPIYELTKTGSHFFTVSGAEMSKAQRSGYTASLFARGCLQQPQDTGASLRSINLFQEFRNMFIK